MHTFPLQDITLLIPEFYDDLDMIDTDSMPLPPIDDEDEPESGRSQSGPMADPTETGTIL